MTREAILLHIVNHGTYHRSFVRSWRILDPLTVGQRVCF